MWSAKLRRKRPEEGLVLTTPPRNKAPGGISSSAASSPQRSKERSKGRSDSFYMTFLVLLAVVSTIPFLSSHRNNNFSIPNDADARSLFETIAFTDASWVSSMDTHRIGNLVAGRTQNVMLDIPLSPHPLAFRETSTSSSNPFYTNLTPLRRILDPDFGGLEIESLQLQPRFVRRIPSNDAKLYNHQRRKQLHAIDYKKLSHKYYSWEDRVDIEDPRGCARPKWAYEQKPICNTFHELQMELSPALQDYDVKYLSRGYFRETYMFTPIAERKLGTNTRRNRSRIPEIQLDATTATATAASNTNTTNNNKFVLKHLRYFDDFEFDIWDYLSIHNEALVFELMTGSSRFTDLYGMCATSTMVQAAQELTYTIVPPPTEDQKVRGRIKQSKLDQLQNKDGGGGHEVHPMNDLTARQKVEIALAMAESIAEMHGFRGGVIVHNDIQPDQWLITEEGRIVLNDVNNAVTLEWNDEKQEYCDFKIEYSGNFRSAEEYQHGVGVDERADVFTFGNQIFTLLTGLWPFYDVFNDEKIANATIAGKQPYLDPGYRERSKMERRLVDLMYECLQLAKEDRPTIFYVVEVLRETLREAETVGV